MNEPHAQTTHEPPYQRWPLSRASAWSIALVATLTMAVSYVDRQTLAALAPTVSRQLGINETGYGLLAAGFSLAYLVTAPLAGRWIDAVGARRGLLLSILAWSAVAAGHALAPGFAAMFALRIALGMTESPSFPGAAQTLQRALPPSHRSAGFGVLYTGSSLGAALAPPLAVALEARFGWRAAFVGTALVGLVWLPLWLAVTGRPAARRVLDAAPSASESPRPQSSTVVVIRELLAHRAVRRAMLVLLAVAPLVAFLLLWGAKFLVGTFRVPQREVGRYLWLPPVAFDVGSVGFGVLASRIEARWARARTPLDRPHRALFAIGVALATACVAAPLAQTPWQAVGLMSVAMAGAGGAWAIMTADLMARVAPDRVSTAGGVCAATQSLAYIVANPLIGVAVDRTHDYRMVLAALSLWVIPGCVLWALWPPPAKVLTDAASASELEREAAASRA